MKPKSSRIEPASARRGRRGISQEHGEIMESQVSTHTQTQQGAVLQSSIPNITIHIPQPQQAVHSHPTSTAQRDSGDTRFSVGKRRVILDEVSFVEEVEIRIL